MDGQQVESIFGSFTISVLIWLNWQRQNDQWWKCLVARLLQVLVDFALSPLLHGSDPETSAELEEPGEQQESGEQPESVLHEEAGDHDTNVPNNYRSEVQQSVNAEHAAEAIPSLMDVVSVSDEPKKLWEDLE